MAISKTETGMDYVQVMPDNPSVGQVKPFRGRGYGQLLNNGTFDFTRRPRMKSKPELKLRHSSVSFGRDGFDRYVFTLPNEQRMEFAKLLKQETTRAIKFMNDQK